MKDSPWFRHDSNAARDPKMLRLRAKWGAEGYGAFWLLAEVMHEQDEGKVLRSDIPVWAVEFRYERLAEFVDFCCELGLYECDDTAFWSNRMVREKEWRASMAEQRSLAGRKSAERRFNARSTAVEQPFNTDIHTDIQTNKQTKEECAPLVHLTAEEKKQLIADYGAKGAAACFEKLSVYKGANGKKYKSDYLAIRNWVVDALKLTPRSRASPGAVCPVCGTPPAGTEGFCRRCGLDKSEWKDTTAVAEARLRWDKQQA